MESMVLDIHSILRKTDVIGSRLSFKSTERKVGPAALFDLAHEHAKSIALLIDSKLYGSAYALLRACIEAYIRGSWLLHCATDEQVDRFTNRDAKWPSLSSQMNDLEGHHELPGAFNRYLGKTMGTLDALTHGLSIQIKWRFNESHIEFVMSDEDKYELAREISFISILAHVGMADISNDEKAVKELEAIFPELDTFNKLSKRDAEKPGAPS
jgi:hypothetical protein